MSSALPPRRDVLGVGISETTLSGATLEIIRAAKSGLPLSVAALAVHAVMEARSSAEYQARLNTLDIATPDGQPVRWALNFLHGAHLKERVYGPFLMREVCAEAAREGIPIYLFGSEAETLSRLSANLSAAHKGLVIAGSRASRFRKINEAEAREDAEAIAASGARIVFCGLGCPRQESWVHAMRPMISAPLIGVGAAFALWAGERDMAPAWMQDRGFEWLFRLGQEPGRLARRYLVQGPGFFTAVAAQKMGLRPTAPSPRPVGPDYWG